MRFRLLGSLLLLIARTIAAAASLDLVASKDKPFCEQVLELLQKNMGSGNRLNIEAKPFSLVKWEPALIAGAAPKMRRCSSVDKASTDLDNDGTKDLMVKATFCMKGAPSDSFYMFPADSNVLEQASWQDMAPLLATTDKFGRTGGKLPADRASDVFRVEQRRASFAHGIHSAAVYLWREDVRRADRWSCGMDGDRKVFTWRTVRR